MPDRRPYASRGVPRRVTTRWSGNQASTGKITLVLVFVLTFAGAAVWWTSSFLEVLGGVAASAPPSTAQLHPVGPPAADRPALLQVVLTPGASAAAPDTQAATQAREPTVRQWEARVAGITPDAALISRLDRALAGVDGRIGVAVKDLGSGRGAVLDGDLELQSASLYKLTVLYSVFASGVGLYEELPITDEALSYDTGSMELGPGETLSVAEALERMVTLSDNTSAIMLSGRVGASRIISNLSALGMDTTHYSLDRMTTSPLDMLHLVELMADGKAVSPAASADMVHMLLRQRVNDRLPRLLPDDVQVAHKTGNLPGTVNDVGIIYGPTSTVAIAALVSDTTDEAAAAVGIARVAQAAYTYFEEQPEAPVRPLIPPAPARPIPPVWREPRPPTLTPVPTPEATTVALAEVAATPTLSPLVATTPVRPTAVPTQVPPTAAPTLKPTAPPAATATPAPPPPTPPPPTKAPARPATATPVKR